MLSSNDSTSTSALLCYHRTVENEDSNMRRTKEKDYEFVDEGLTASNEKSSRTIVSREVPHSLLLPRIIETLLLNDLSE